MAPEPKQTEPDPTVLDVDAMVRRFAERAAVVRGRPLPPVAGPEREKFLAQAQLDYQDFAMLGDATWELVDGVLILRIDLRPPDADAPGPGER